MSRRVILQKGEVINNHRYCVVSFVGPTMRQKHEVYGIKVYCATEDRETADAFAEQIREKEEGVFDVYVMDTNAWAPLDVSPEEIKDQRFAQQILDEMLHKQKENHERAQSDFEKKVQERKNAVKHELSEDGQKQRADETESPLAVLFKIKQYKDLIKQRSEELEELQKIYITEFSEAERQDAEERPLPQTQPGQMVFDRDRSISSTS